MITLSFFTSGHLTQPVIDALKNAADIKLLHVYQKLPEKIETADLFLVADFGQILPQEIINLPKYGTLCLHPSLLPQYRGASPVQQVLIDGVTKTGLTIFQVDEKVDHGPIVTQVKEKIGLDDTAGSLYERLFKIGGGILPEVIKEYVIFQSQKSKVKSQNENLKFKIFLPPKPQDDSVESYTKKLTKEDGRINWSWEPKKIERFIRALTPWPVAWSFITPEKSGPKTNFAIPEKSTFEVKSANTSKVKNGVKSFLTLKILQAHLEKEKLVLDLVQLPGKKPISYSAFLSGHQNWQFL